MARKLERLEDEDGKPGNGEGKKELESIVK
jgi:hypothetical protein